MRAIIRGTMVSLVAAGLILGGAAHSAWACSCAAASETDYFEGADVVFTGVVIDRTDPNAGAQIRSSADPIDYTVDVESIQKGRVDDPATVRTAQWGGSCGVSFTVGDRYHVFGDRNGDVIEASMCGGTKMIERGAAAGAKTTKPVARHSVAPAPEKTAPTTPSALPAATLTPAVDVIDAGSADDLTTVAAGDVVPVSDPAKPLAGTFAVILAVAVLGGLRRFGRSSR